MDFVHRLVIALPLAVAGTSLLSLYPTLPCDPDAEDGGIVLPLKPAGRSGGYGVVPDEEEEEELGSDDDEELVAREEKTLDPFDFRADSLVTDGYPVDEQGFWRKVSPPVLVLVWSSSPLAPGPYHESISLIRRRSSNQRTYSSSSSPP